MTQLSVLFLNELILELKLYSEVFIQDPSNFYAFNFSSPFHTEQLLFTILPIGQESLSPSLPSLPLPKCKIKKIELPITFSDEFKKLHVIKVLFSLGLRKTSGNQ